MAEHTEESGEGSQTPVEEHAEAADPSLQPGSAETLPGGSVQTGQPEELSRPDQFNWRGWLLVAVVLISFVVVPAIVFFIPEAHWLISRLGFTPRQAYIVFPMIPAILLGATAVWAALRTHSSTE